MKCLIVFQDLGGKDIYLKQIFLVCHIVRTGGMYNIVYVCIVCVRVCVCVCVRARVCVCCTCVRACARVCS